VRDPKVPALSAAAAIIAAIPLWLGRAGLHTYFTGDDLMNLYAYWSKPWGSLLTANLAYYSPFYRPMGGLFYRGLFAAFGFEPLAFRVACFAVMLLNLVLFYLAAQRLAGSREAGVLAALLGCYHGGFGDLYYNTGTIYDLLCFSFYVGALLIYMRARAAGRWPRTHEAVTVFGLYICALNSKEMAVTLPAAMLAYELIYHAARKLWDLRYVCATALMTAPYVFGKLSAESPFPGNEAYRPMIGAETYLNTYRYYLDIIFYQRPGWFTPARTAALFAAMVLIAALSRKKELRFSAAFVLFSVFPVIFIPPRGTVFVLYIPFLGWCVFAASLLLAIREKAAFRFVRMDPRAATAATFALMAASLFTLHHKHTAPPQPDTIQSASEQLQAAVPHIGENSRVLLLDDPFAPDEDLIPFYILRLSRENATVQVFRGKKMALRPKGSEVHSYDAVLAYENNRFVRVARRD
jgi:hypothetical protein